MNATASKLASWLLQLLRGVASELDWDRCAGQLGGHPLARRGVRLSGYQAAGAAEIPEALPGPRAHVEHLARQIREQASPPFP